MLNNNNCTIYFINLDSSSDRLEQITKQLERENIDHIRFSAVDGNVKTKDFFRETMYFTKEFIDNSKEGMLACISSHIEVWNLIYKQKKEYAIVFEDDIIIDSNFWDKLNNYMTQIKDSYDLIYLGGSNLYTKKISCNILKPLLDCNKLHNIGAYAYLIKKDNIDTLLELVPFNDDLDFRIKNKVFNRNKVFYLYPPIITHNNKINSDRRIADKNTPIASIHWRTNLQPNITIKSLDT